MTVLFRLLLVSASLSTMLYFLSKIRKSRMQLEDSIFWLLISFLWIILSIFPGILIFFADILGVQSPVNFLYLLMIFVLIMRNFSMTVKISAMEEKLKRFAQVYATEKLDSTYNTNEKHNF